jgi:hypothetical protein
MASKTQTTTKQWTTPHLLALARGRPKEFLLRYPVFTRGEFAAAYRARGAGTPRAVEALIAYRTGAGHLVGKAPTRYKAPVRP